ncbi:MAG: GxxExxY protein [Puniceicoccales bacterium]|jgi:GxxExxY protein|nr:GxxExxY protein [Puniceicoccales bacterium]
MEHSQLTEKIIHCAYAVHNEIGSGLLESVYEKAMMIALRKSGLDVAAQVPLKVFFQGECGGDFYADIIVNDTVILELKACRSLAAEHEVQLVNYLNIARKEIGLLINFGESKVEVRRKHRKYEPSTRTTALAD